MYRSRRGGGIAPILVLVVLGIVAGGGYFLYDNVFRGSSGPEALPTVFSPPTWTPESVVVVPTVTAAANAIPTLDPNVEFPTIFIPNAGVVAPIVTLFVENGQWDVDGLGPRVGHLQRTPWLNQPGNIVLAGHVEMQDGRVGVFSTLGNLQPGDDIVLTEQQVDYRYAVREVKYVQPTDLSVLYSTDSDTLTLITCSDFNFLEQAYARRLVVIADSIPG